MKGTTILRSSLGVIAVVIAIILTNTIHAAPRGTQKHPPATHRPAPAHSSAASAARLAPLHGAIPGWLHTAGTSIVDAAGRPVRLVAVNWYGAEGGDYVPGGLSYKPYLTILRTIKALGFNAVRLPFSNALVERNPIVRAHLDANPSLRGKHALTIMDTIISGARQVGLMVILDDHRSNPGWTAQENGLWYDLPRYTPQGWLADWEALARRYADNPAVVGFDLRNEPHSNGPGLEILGDGYLRHGATWGPFMGKDNPATDWRLAAQEAGNAILALDPRVLVIVEGTEVYPTYSPTAAACPGHAPLTFGYCPDLYWWGGNLQGVRAYPIVLNVPHQLVYSPHEYGPQMHSQRWITPSMTEADWQQVMYNHWGYLLNATGPYAAPVWVGEFGTPLRKESDFLDGNVNGQGRWFSSLVHYLQRYPNVGWGYWAINGTSSGSAGRPYGQRDIFGLMTTDWAHLSHPTPLKALRPILP